MTETSNNTTNNTTNDTITICVMESTRTKLKALGCKIENSDPLSTEITVLQKEHSVVYNDMCKQLSEYITNTYAEMDIPILLSEIPDIINDTTGGTTIAMKLKEMEGWL